MSETISNCQAATQELAVTANVPPSQHTIEEITTKILQQKGQVVHSFFEIGNLLIEAKEQLIKHGEWLKWLSTKVDISERTAQRYMQLATAFSNPTSVSDLGMTKALAMMALPEAQRGDFINELHEVNGKQKKVNEMSVRELKQTIHEKIKTIEKKQHPMPLEVVKKETWAYKKVSRELETAQELLICVVKFLRDPPSDPIPEKISTSLRSLYESAKKCMVLADLEI